jgi:hypothetical protein
VTGSPFECVGVRAAEISRRAEAHAYLATGTILLTCPELRQSRRIAAFFYLVAANLALLRPVLMG